LRRFGYIFGYSQKAVVIMAMRTRESREAELLVKVQSESGREELLKRRRFQLGLQPDQSLPPGSSLVGGLLDHEFGAIGKPEMN
jgi:hypothetical protein